jgi:hypothetical protein
MMRSVPEDGRWYAYCVAFMATKPALRPRKSRQTLAHYRRIAALPPASGALLDEGGAPFYLLRWIAWGKTRSAVKARFEDVLRYHALFKGWPTEAGLCSGYSLGEVIEAAQRAISGTG